MAFSPSSTTTEASCQRKRKRQSSSEEDDNSGLTTNSPNSSGSGGGSDQSIEHNIPQDISKWTEEHLMGLSITTLYQENTTPLDLIKMFSQKYRHRHSWVMSNFFLPMHIDDIEEYFNRFCDFHKSLDEDFQSISGSDANLIRHRNRYNANEFLASGDFGKKEEMQYWFRRFETCGVNFGQKLYSMVRKRQLNGEDCGKVVLDRPTEYDFQYLFSAFAAMFGLESYDWYEPFMPRTRLQLHHVPVAGKADILYCQDMGYTKEDVSQSMHIVAVCEVSSVTDSGNKSIWKGYTARVKKHFPEIGQQEYRITRGSESSSSSNSSRLPPHIPLTLLGQHGGELLMYYSQSLLKDVIFGLIVQETKVTFTALKMTEEQYKVVKKGKFNTPPAELIITRAYDYMKKEDRKFLIRPFLELAMMQEVKAYF